MAKFRVRTERIRFPKEVRVAVHAKCHGHCAYCGAPITIREMQIDHVRSLEMGGSNDLSNLLPACRQCNFYKSTWTLESFRNILLTTFPNATARLFNVRLALKYGFLVKGHGWDGKFYFEKLQEKKQGKRPDGNAD